MRLLPIPEQTLNRDICALFSDGLKKLDLKPSLNVFCDKNIVNELIQLGLSMFMSPIENAKRNLANDQIGASVIDISESMESLFVNTAISLSIAWNMIQAASDTVNNTPFTVYTASHQNSLTLSQIGQDKNVPEVKLGFHADGLLDNDDVFIPNKIALYNMTISYNKPGKFYWLPYSRWKELRKFSDIIGVDKRYPFKLVRSVYEDANGVLKINGKEKIDAPIFVRHNEKLSLFLNGEIEVDCEKSREGITNMRRSIESNEVRYFTDQKANRLILLNNTSGCHARDIFEEPIAKNGITRAYLRVVDQEGIKISSCR